MKPGICTHIELIVTPRTITFSRRNTDQTTRFASWQPDAQHQRAKDFRQRKAWTAVKAEGSGVITPLTYRQQLARDAIANGTFTKLATRPKRRKP